MIYTNGLKQIDDFANTAKGIKTKYLENTLSTVKNNSPGIVPPNGGIIFGEKNEDINATIAYGVHAIVKVTEKRTGLTLIKRNEEVLKNIIFDKFLKYFGKHV